MMALTLRIITSPQVRPDAVQALRPLVGPTEAKPGCGGCGLFGALDESDQLLWAERWETRAALEDHIRSHEFLALLAVMDMSTREPELRVYTISEAAGLELVERVRKPGD
jgi:quinol monooxygenase YgiN